MPFRLLSKLIYMSALGLFFSPVFSLSTVSHAMTPEQFFQLKQAGLNKPQLTLTDIAPLIAHYQQHPLVVVQQLGESVQGRPIYQLTIGRGDTRILAWSQMHGDEHTTTAALFDLLKYITDDVNSAWRDSWLDNISLHLVPMLNPDGAERNTRVNAQGIDINRDALALQSPEGRLLMQLGKQLQPKYGFNLHDQNRFHAAGPHPNPATISLLAPAYNEARDINDSRKAAMQLIAHVKPLIENSIPQHLGRYDDTFSPRSFGDTFASFGISTVLVEAGGHRGDDNRQVARRLNLMMYIAFLNAIHTGSYRQADLADYEAIPFNRRNGMKDLILHKVQLEVSELPATVDIAVNLQLESNRQARIDDIGDLSVHAAYHEYDASGLQYQAGKAYKLSKPQTLTREAYLTLLAQGYSHFTGKVALLDNRSGLPVVLNPGRLAGNEPRLGEQASFLLVNDQGVQLALINGQLIDVPAGKQLTPLGT